MEPTEGLPPLDLNLKLFKKNTGKLLEYSRLKREVCPLIRTLYQEPQTDFQRRLLSDEDAEEDVENIDTYIQQCKQLLQELRAKLEGQLALEKALWERLVDCRGSLLEENDPSLEFCPARKDLIDGLQKLLQVHEEAQVKRDAWIAKNILEIRKELQDTWNQCMVTSDEAHFRAFTAINFSNELLELHKEELIKWKAYHARNQILFDQIEKRAQLWEQMKELQAKADDPHRFLNRGGVLLKSQKESNYVNKALPKCEEKLITMAKNFEKENGRKLLLCGKPIVQKIEDDWKEFKESTRKKRAAARTISVDLVPENSLSSLRRSVSHGNLSSRRNIAEIGLKTGEKRITIRQAPGGIKKFRLNDDITNDFNNPNL